MFGPGSRDKSSGPRKTREFTLFQLAGRGGNKHHAAPGRYLTPSFAKVFARRARALPSTAA
jgi:hypothetical protein